MLNSVSLTGRLTADPEIRFTQSGVPVTSFSLAVNRNFKNEAGESQADFINCVCWRERAELIANTLKKGALIGVNGRLETRNYDNSEGRKIFVTEVNVGDFTYLEKKEVPVEPYQARYSNNRK